MVKPIPIGLGLVFLFDAVEPRHRAQLKQISRTAGATSARFEALSGHGTGSSWMRTFYSILLMQAFWLFPVLYTCVSPSFQHVEEEFKESSADFTSCGKTPFPVKCQPAEESQPFVVGLPQKGHFLSIRDSTFGQGIVFVVRLFILRGESWGPRTRNLRALNS